MDENSMDEKEVMGQEASATPQGGGGMAAAGAAGAAGAGGAAPAGKSGRDRFAERMKSKYPDREFADDEALYSQANDDYDDYDRQLGEYQGREKQLTDMFNSNPRSANFLMAWRDGEDPIMSLVRTYGDELREALDDPEKQEELAKASQEFADRVAKEKEYEEEYQRNMQETLQTISALESKEGWSPEQSDAAVEFILQNMRDAIMGKFTREALLAANKALNYDGDLAVADRTGEVRGRNAKIEEKLRTANRSDGTASLAGSTQAMRPQQTGRRRSIFDEAEEAE